MPSDDRPSFRLFQIRTQKINPSIPVYLPHNLTTLDLAALLPVSPAPPAYTFPALENWITRLLQNFALQESDPSHPFHKHPYKLRELDIQAVDWFWRDVPGKEDKLGFMKIQAKIETDPYVHEGEEKERADWLPGAVFLRGGSVAMLVSHANILQHIYSNQTTSKQTQETNKLKPDNPPTLRRTP